MKAGLINAKEVSGSFCALGLRLRGRRLIPQASRPLTAFNVCTAETNIKRRNTFATAASPTSSNLDTNNHTPKQHAHPPRRLAGGAWQIPRSSITSTSTTSSTPLAHFAAINGGIVDGTDFMMQEFESTPDELVGSPRYFFVGGRVVWTTRSGGADEHAGGVILGGGLGLGGIVLFGLGYYWHFVRLLLGIFSSRGYRDHDEGCLVATESWSLLFWTDNSHPRRGILASLPFIDLRRHNMKRTFSWIEYPDPHPCRLRNTELLWGQVWGMR